MTPEMWQQIQSILDRALELSGDTRRAYLDSACTEPELRKEVESLLSGELNVDGFLAKPCPHSIESIKRGDRIGAFEIIEMVGEGGMGAVFKARDLELNQASQSVPDAAARRSNDSRLWFGARSQR